MSLMSLASNILTPSFGVPCYWFCGGLVNISFLPETLDSIEKIAVLFGTDDIGLASFRVFVESDQTGDGRLFEVVRDAAAADDGVFYNGAKLAAEGASPSFTNLTVTDSITVTDTVSAELFSAGSSYSIGATQVVGGQGAAVADATGAGDVVAQLNALLARIRAHGLIAT